MRNAADRSHVAPGLGALIAGGVAQTIRLQHRVQSLFHAASMALRT